MAGWKPNFAAGTDKSDLNKGVHIRYTTSGIAVYHFPSWLEVTVDAKTGQELSRVPHPGKPGYFYNEHGDEVAVALAKEAGFDVDSLLRERTMREKQAQAMAAIEAEFAVAGAKHEVVASQGEYTVVDIGMDRYNVEGPDGSVMNTAGPIPSREVALRVLAAVAPPVPEPDPEEEIAA